MSDEKRKIVNGAYIESFVHQIIDDYWELGSLAKALKKNGAINKHFDKALMENPLLEQLYTRAQQAQSEFWAEETIEIADTEENPQKARNRIESRRWMAAKVKPHKFGDRIDLNINQTVDLKGALLEAKSRSMQVIDIQPKYITNETDLESVAPIEDSSDELDRILGIGPFSEKDPAGGAGEGEKK